MAHHTVAYIQYIIRINSVMVRCVWTHGHLRRHPPALRLCVRGHRLPPCSPDQSKRLNVVISKSRRARQLVARQRRCVMQDATDPWWVYVLAALFVPYTIWALKMIFFNEKD